jgi:hypothetical protein
MSNANQAKACEICTMMFWHHVFMSGRDFVLCENRQVARAANLTFQVHFNVNLQRQNALGRVKLKSLKAAF